MSLAGRRSHQGLLICCGLYKVASHARLRPTSEILQVLDGLGDSLPNLRHVRARRLPSRNPVLARLPRLKPDESIVTSATRRMSFGASHSIKAERLADPRVTLRCMLADLEESEPSNNGQRSMRRLALVKVRA